MGSNQIFIVIVMWWDIDIFIERLLKLCHSVLATLSHLILFELLAAVFSFLHLVSVCSTYDRVTIKCLQKKIDVVHLILGLFCWQHHTWSRGINSFCRPFAHLFSRSSFAMHLRNSFSASDISQRPGGHILVGAARFRSKLSWAPIRSDQPPAMSVSLKRIKGELLLGFRP